jgi:hypothetical protein
MDKLIYFTSNLRLSLETSIRIILLSKWIGILKSDKKLNKKSCIILGNGPSFKITIDKHVEILRHHDLVCVNNFALTDYYESLSPKYYIINAKIIFLDDAAQSEFWREIKKSLFDALVMKTSWDIEIMVPFIAKKSIDFQNILVNNSNLKAIYYNHTSIEGFLFLRRFFFKLKLGTPRPHNVVIPAIMNMIFLDYKKIGLIGVDHGWLEEITVNKKNEAFVNQKHFYDENTSKPEKMQDYSTRPRRLHEILHKFYLSFRGYWEIKTYAEKKKIEIYNCSETSMIDAFERKPLTDL